MWQKLKQQVWQLIKQEQGSMIMIASSIAGVVITTNLVGVFQLLEWSTLDQFFRWRPSEPIEPHIVVVTIDETDITKVGQWPIPDGTIADLIEKLKLQKPKVIGIDIYRNLKVEPGHDKLVEVFQSTPNLIAVEKSSGKSVVPPPAFAKPEQVGLSDLVIDADGKVRRGLISIHDQKSKFGLAIKLSLDYLKTQGITPEESKNNPQQINLGKATFLPFQPNDGAYINADAGGYQILLNFRGGENKFQTVSMTSVLKGQIPKDLMRDRIVLIGSTAESIRDFFQTPYAQTPGIIIHANLISQIINGALYGRPFIKVVSDPVEWLWILLWSLIGTTVSWRLLQLNFNGRTLSPSWTAMGLVVAGGFLVISDYLLFLAGWWIPMVSPLVALTMGGIVSTGYYNEKLQRLASIDALTKVANRRYFDQYLRQKATQKGTLALILCDVDCFKLYNDTYGHQAGDYCLQKVAEALRNAVRSSDLVARYGGEEFVVVLPNTNVDVAMQVAERMLEQVRKLNIDHINSKAKEYVTISCGVANIIISNDFLPTDLILKADKALYVAKESGRDRAIVGVTE